MEFTKKEEATIKRTVKHYRDMDANRDKVKANVDDTLNELADFIDKNYATFVKEPNKVFRAYAVKAMKKSLPEFEKSINEGQAFIKDVL